MRLVLFLVLSAALAAVLMTACSSVPVPPQPDLDSGAEGPLTFSPSGKPVAVVLVFHGLNIRPSAMNRICRLLTDHSAIARRVVLPGHGQFFGVFHEVSQDSWLAAARQEIGTARKQATELGVPLEVVAFSLGAVVSLDAEIRFRVPVDKAVYIAPAIVPRPLANLVRLLASWTGVAINSQSPASYRGGAATPVVAYNAMMACQDEVEDGGRPESPNHAAWLAVARRPTLVIDDPDDAVVDGAASVRLFGAESNWTFLALDGREYRVANTWRHLMIDEQTLIPESWQRLRQAIELFLFSSATAAVP